jgi:putative ABC transport system permease protein
MKPGTFKLILRSLLFYKRSSFYQAAIVFILAAIITGSLLTGYSVRQSLKITASEHLGNADILISSGQRYFDATLSYKIILNSGENCVSILEANGYCQNFATGTTSLNTKIWGITPGFFSFNGNDSLDISPGSIAINQNLAQHLGIKTGDDIIVHYTGISPFPENAPFAPSKSEDGTKVLKVTRILKPEQSGNFSLGISQIAPMNVFMNLSEMSYKTGSIQKANRILIENRKNISREVLQRILMKSVSASDIGLTVRQNKTSGRSELISERIFIDQEIVDEVGLRIPSSRPVITYLANSLRKNEKTTPYSFVSAVPSYLYPGVLSGNKIVINNWLADDLNAIVNDTISLTWYSPTTGGVLVEKSDRFIISQVVKIDGIWDDPSLMPEFPGIAGSASCSDWDAGVAVNMKLVRNKDEAYWNSFKGTPKAFISYSKGKELWGSNFGPATAIRFPSSMSKKEIEESLKGSFFPERTGFSINDIRADAFKAAGESVDFSTLFLSLGFFIILSCIILLALSVSLFFDSRKDQIFTYFALGFKDKWIKRLLFLETSAIALAGIVPGVFTGSLISFLIIAALNSVWSGAVQTNSLDPHMALFPMISGFLITLIISMILLGIKTGFFLKSLKKTETGLYKGHSKKRNLLLFSVALLITLLTIGASFLSERFSISLSFAGGTALFITLILFVRLYFIGGFNKFRNKLTDQNALSRLYYSFNPSHALTPVIFIAAGIFAVFITGINRLDISNKMKEPSGGTGGFSIWCETAVPVKFNLNSTLGRNEFGLNEETIKEILFVQAKKSQGDDASCLNLNHIAAPPLLGLDPSIFINKGSFSFSSIKKGLKNINPWEAINIAPKNNTIYGIADQTVLQWGLKLSVGDTLILKSESGQQLNVIIAAGLKSSVFQGFVIIGTNNFEYFFPSNPGSSVFLATGKPELAEIYQKVLRERFSNYGISVIPAIERLASFFKVTNTYLSVFTVLGAFGMLLGIAGMGFILMRNYNQRKREFSLMNATGYSLRWIRKMILKEQIIVLAAGILTGTLSAIIVTLPSLTSGSKVPWSFLLIMTILVFLTGLIALTSSVRMIRNDSLIASLRKE